MRFLLTLIGLIRLPGPLAAQSSHKLSNRPPLAFAERAIPRRHHAINPPGRHDLENGPHALHRHRGGLGEIGWGRNLASAHQRAVATPPVAVTGCAAGAEDTRAFRSGDLRLIGARLFDDTRGQRRHDSRFTVQTAAGRQRHEQQSQSSDIAEACPPNCAKPHPNLTLSPVTQRRHPERTTEVPPRLADEIVFVIKQAEVGRRGCKVTIRRFVRTGFSSLPPHTRG